MVCNMLCFHLHTACAAAKGKVAACLESRSRCLGNSSLDLALYALKFSFDVLRWKDGVREGMRLERILLYARASECT